MSLEEALVPLRELVEGTIDFEGQALAEKYTDIVTYAGLTFSLLVGLILQRVDIAVYLGGAAYALVFVLCFPLPFYRKNPVEWRTPRVMAT